VKKWISKSRLSKKGFIIPIVVMVMTVLLLVGNSVLGLGFYSRLKSDSSTSDIYARAAADAALTLAMYKMNQKLASEEVWDNSTLSNLNMTGVALANSNGTFTYTISGDPAGGFSIKATGTSGRATRTIIVGTRLKSIFDFAIAVKDDLTLYPNSAARGYNSKDGSTGHKIQIGTNTNEDNSVIILNNAVVDGDVYVGVDGDPDTGIDNKGTIVGDAYRLPYVMDFPEVSVPESLNSKGSINNTITIGASDSGEYSSISLGNSKVITVDGGSKVVMHVTGDIRMNNGSEIIIKPGTSLVMYVDGDWESKEGAGINNENGIPANFKLFGTGPEGQEIDLKAKTDFYGAVYAPNAEIGIKAGGDMYGSFVGDSYEMKSKSTFNYDIALREVTINDEDARLYVQSWGEQ
jgi:hypothetical protein